jgi:sphingomyelin phosphodiesterase acid-like 3
LGNEDSYCGDYQLQPAGEFLRGTADSWKLLFDDSNERAFMQTFPTGGYYAASAPGTPKHRVIVLNTVFFSADYQNQCGNPKDDPGGDQMRWLTVQLKDATAKQERVWLLYHIPPGIDAYNTAMAPGGNTAEKVVSYWQAGYLENFLKLLDQYRDTIVFTLAGHTHMDDFRLARDGETGRSSFLVVTPAISPIFGNNPGLQVLSYDRKTFSVLDYTTHQLDLAAAPPSQRWKEEYRFSQAYRLFPLTGSTLETLFRSLQKDALSRATYIRYYNVSNTASPPITDQTWPIYWCAIDHLTVAAFEACRQRFPQPEAK